MSRDYYSDLNIHRDASDEEIAKAYRKLSLEWHPSCSDEDPKTQNHYFCLISEAFEVLSDPVKRAFYDKYGEEKLKQGLFSQGELKGGYRFANNPEQIFNDFYGKNNAFAQIFDAKGSEELGSLFGSQFGAQNYKGNSPPVDRYVEVEVTLEEIYNGCSKEVSYDVIDLKNDQRNTCTKSMSQQLDISQGIKDGSTIVYDGKGNKAPFQKPSNLIFTIIQKPHDRFTRKKNDLIYTQKITLIEALDSPPVEIRTLDGRTILVSMDTLINPNTVKQVKGEGMPIYKKSQTGKVDKGDLYIKFDIEFPQTLTQEQKSRIKELLE